MKWTVSLAVLALAASSAAALAQTTKPDVSAAPSAQNSGAGIAGQPGNKTGPAARAGRHGGRHLGREPDEPDWATAGHLEHQGAARRQERPACQEAGS